MPREAPKKPGPGRPKGSRNKLTVDIKRMVQTALTNAGGVEYLTQQAQENPKAFLPLVAKLLPTRVEGDSDNPLRVIHSIKRVIINGKSGSSDNRTSD